MLISSVRSRSRSVKSVSEPLTTEEADVLLSTLTPVQRQALDLRARGLYYREIGERLGLSESCIHKMVTRACRALDLSPDRMKMKKLKLIKDLPALSDTVLMLVTLESAINAGVEVQAGSPCHRRLRKVLRAQLAKERRDVRLLKECMRIELWPIHT